MPCSCYPKAKAIQSCVRKQNNCASFDRRLAYRRNQHDWCRFTRSVQKINCGLRTADNELQPLTKAVDTLPEKDLLS